MFNFFSIFINEIDSKNFYKQDSKNKKRTQLKTHLFTFTIMNEALAKLQSFQQIISHSINEHENDFFPLFHFTFK